MSKQKNKNLPPAGITVTEMADFFEISRAAILKVIAKAAKERPVQFGKKLTHFVFRGVKYSAIKFGNQYSISPVL